MSEVLSEVKLRKVVPEVLRDETERGELLEDLQAMGCSGFLEKPWGFKDDRVVRELLDGVSNEFDNSIRAAPIRWTEECWREVYHFSTGSGGLAGRKDEYVKDCFKDLPSPKDGYSIEDCKDPRHMRLLAFLVPIVYPEKPNRITITWDNTIFGALNGGRKVNWARIITTLRLGREVSCLPNLPISLPLVRAEGVAQAGGGEELEDPGGHAEVW
jgi:hypothetical protein